MTNPFIKKALEDFDEKFVNHGEFVYNKGGYPAMTGEIKDFLATTLNSAYESGKRYRGRGVLSPSTDPEKRERCLERAKKDIQPQTPEWEDEWKDLNPNWTELQILFIGCLLKDQRQSLIEAVENLMTESTAKDLGDQLENRYGRRLCSVCGTNPEKQREMILNILKDKVNQH